MTENMNKKAGIALIAGAVISILRVVPIVASDGVTRDNFPPETVEDIVFFAQLQGWHISHVLIFVLIPLFLFGISGLASEAARSGQQSAGRMAAIGTSISMGLFAIATVLDGFVLPALAEEIEQNNLSPDSHTAALTLFTHETASIFGGVASGFLLITALFIGIALLKGLEVRPLGIIGVVIGLTSTIGYLTGLLAVNISDDFGRVGPLLMIMFIYLLAVGAQLTRTQQTLQP